MLVAGDRTRCGLFESWNGGSRTQGLPALRCMHWAYSTFPCLSVSKVRCHIQCPVLRPHKDTSWDRSQRRSIACRTRGRASQSASIPSFHRVLAGAHQNNLSPSSDCLNFFAEYPRTMWPFHARMIVSMKPARATKPTVSRQQKP